MAENRAVDIIMEEVQREENQAQRSGNNLSALPEFVLELPAQAVAIPAAAPLPVEAIDESGELDLKGFFCSKTCRLIMGLLVIILLVLIAYASQPAYARAGHENTKYVADPGTVFETEPPYLNFTLDAEEAGNGTSNSYEIIPKDHGDNELKPIMVHG